MSMSFAKMPNNLLTVVNRSWIKQFSRVQRRKYKTIVNILRRIRAPCPFWMKNKNVEMFIFPVFCIKYVHGMLCIAKCSFGLHTCLGDSRVLPYKTEKCARFGCWSYSNWLSLLSLLFLHVIEFLWRFCIFVLNCLYEKRNLSLDRVKSLLFLFIFYGIFRKRWRWADDLRCYCVRPGPIPFMIYFC